MFGLHSTMSVKPGSAPVTRTSKSVSKMSGVLSSLSWMASRTAPSCGSRIVMVAVLVDTAKSSVDASTAGLHVSAAPQVTE